jgi:hypothetical protein
MLKKCRLIDGQAGGTDIYQFKGLNVAKESFLT